MEKINIAELLKDCPKGMELDCTMFEDVKFIDIDEGDKPICIRTGDIYRYLTKFGTWTFDDNAKCLIYPKGKTTWEGFQRPFKDGDILATNLGRVFYLNTRLTDDERYGCYVGICTKGSLRICEFFAYKECCKLATEEEKEKLFKAIKDNGYKWNEETKILEKLSNPKFKVGDRVKHVLAYNSGIVVKVSDKGYYIDYPKGEGVCFISFTLEKDYELAPNKFDINTLKPFDKVLVRDNNAHKWTIDFFGFINEYKRLPFVCVGDCVTQCIPYEGNEHLLGTTNDCDEYFKTWK